MGSWLALFVALLCAAFAASVVRQYVRKRRPHLAYWALSLGLAAIGALGYVCSAVPAGHPVWAFRVYYICGAMAMPAVMGLGSLGLMVRPRVLHAVAAVVGIAIVATAVGIAAAPAHPAGLRALNGGPGVGVLATGWWLPLMIILNSFGALAVFGVAVWSAVHTLHGHAPRRFLGGNVFLALGILVLSGAGSAARLGWPGAFWATMAVGWVMAFVGYVLLTPIPSAAEPSARQRIA